MAIRIFLEDILKDRQMTSKELCALIGITEANLSILRSGKAKGGVQGIPFFYPDESLVNELTILGDCKCLIKAHRISITRTT